MPSIYNDDFSNKRIAGGQDPKGWCESYPWAKVAAIADKIYFGIIPGGVEVNSLDIITDALASGTLSVGWEYVDGSAGGSATAFFNAQTIATAGRFSSAAQPIVFNKPVRLYGTVGGAALLVTTKITPVVSGKGNGIS